MTRGRKERWEAGRQREKRGKWWRKEARGRKTIKAWRGRNMVICVRQYVDYGPRVLCNPCLYVQVLTLLSCNVSIFGERDL